MDYDAIVRWLEAHEGELVLASASLASQNSSLDIIGRLEAAPDREIALIDAPRRARIAIWAVGGATLKLLDNELTSAEVVGAGDDPSAPLLVNCGEQRFSVWPGVNEPEDVGLVSK